MFFEELQNNNQYPIVFIGSGITKRYFDNAPDWEQLLKTLWNEVNDPNAFYSAFHTSTEISDFEAYLHIADKLDSDYTRAFYNQEITIPGLTISEAHKHKISPLRAKIASLFSNLTVKPGMEDEIKEFTAMLNKARMIVTTNYDTFIEERLNFKIATKVGNKGLFENSTEFGELFKLHGTVSNPNSIAISSNDYKTLEETSTLINAKILSTLTESPIIFFGYSVTDQNIRTLLHDFSKNLDMPVEQASKRIAVVEYHEGKEDITEVISELSENIHYTNISTDNFTEIYKAISKINQGITPGEISKYQAAFKKIIEVKGQNAELDTVLATFINLDNFDEDLKNKNIVIAFGDERLVYKTPDYIDYIWAYFYPTPEFPVEIALNYIRKYSPVSTLPITKFIQQANGGFNKSLVKKIPSLVRKVEKRNIKFSSLDSIIKSISTLAHDAEDTLNKLTLDSPLAIYQDTTTDVNEYNRIRYITINIQNYNLDDLSKFTDYLIENVSHKVLEETDFRKYFASYAFILDPDTIDLKV